MLRVVLGSKEDEPAGEVHEVKATFSPSTMKWHVVVSTNFAFGQPIGQGYGLESALCDLAADYRNLLDLTEGADARGQKGPPLVTFCFYIQDTRTYVGDAVLWWRPDGKGYTTKLGEAGVFTAEEADRIHQSRETDKPIPVEAARRAARIVVHGDDLRASLAKEKP